MTNKKRFLAVILSIALALSCCSTVFAANETNTDGVVFTAALDKAQITKNGAEQTVVMTVTTNKAVAVDSAEFDVDCDDELTPAAPTSADMAGFDWNATTKHVVWMTLTAGNVEGVTEICQVQFTVPADIEAGEYIVGISDILLSADAEYWEEGASASAILTVICPHNNTEIRGASNPSCNTAGFTGDTWCLDCETKIADGEEINPTGEHVDADGEWESDGDYHWHTCGCETTFDRDDHTGGEATCKAQAVCTVCGTSYGDLNADNHKGETELRDVVEATCNAGGYTGDTYCLDCGQKIATGKATNPTGEHKDADGKWEFNETQHFYTCGCGTEFGHVNHKGGTATCKTQAVCTACGASYGELNPSKHEGETGERNAVEATHTTAGKKADIYCLACDETITVGTTIKAQGHVGAQKVDQVDATCMATGVKAHYHCDVCKKNYDGTKATAKELTDEELTIEKDPDNHVSDGSNMEYNETQHWGTCECGAQIEPENHKGGKATCVAAPICSVCGQSYGEADPDAHKWDKGVVTVEPTEESEGLKIFTCTNEGCGQTKEQVLPKKNGVSNITPGNPEVEEPVEPEYPFTDIEGEWYEEDVKYVYDLGLMNGVNDGTKFAPEMTTTRAMIVTILWRMEDSPATTGALEFPDVADGMWYTAAIDWASANGIVNGYGDGNFGPEDEVTREQIMAILNRYAQYKGWTEDTAVSMVAQYTCSIWAENNVNWADMSGLLADLGVDVTDMTAKASRAELAAYLSRFMQNIAK